MPARDAFAHRGKIRRRAPLQGSQLGKQNEFLIDGVHDNILTSLATISQLQAVSRTSGMEYRRTKKKILRTARERDVACVPEGSVQFWGGTPCASRASSSAPPRASTCGPASSP
jgi:hypothetical protein